MRQFAAIAGFELRYYLTRLSTWVYFFLFFGITFLLVNVVGGAFDATVANERELLNSPKGIAEMLGICSFLQVLVAAAIFGHSAYRDYETGIFPLFFTSPLSKLSFLGGRFVGALLVNLLIATSVSLGLVLGAVMPYLDVERFGPFDLAAYAQPFVLFTLPNLVFTGAIFFALAALTRQMLANYVGAAVIFISYFIALQFLSQMDQKWLGMMLDPYGIAALNELTRYWTLAERNSLYIPFATELLWNRAIWLGAALLVFAAAFRLFRFAHAPERGRARGAPAAPAELSGDRAVRPARVPRSTRSFGWRTESAQYLSQARSEFRGIVANVYFRAIVLAGLVFLGVRAYHTGEIYGTKIYPVTYSVLDALSGEFWLLVLVVIAFQSGELIWRDRQQRIDGITSSMPTPTWVWFTAKLTALVGAIAVLMTVVLVFGVVSQAARGYFQFELGLYLQRLFVFSLVEMTVWCVFAMAVHVLVNHKYVGHFVVIGFFVGNGYLAELGLEHSLYRFNSGGVGAYSAMNGYGYELYPFLVYKLYWGAFALILAALSNLLWVRSAESHWRQRLRVARARFHGPLRRLAAVSCILFLALTGFVFYNTNVLNEYHSSEETKRLQAAYEKQYKRFENLPQPRVVAVRGRMDLYPERGDLRITATYRLVNRTGVPIDSVHLDYAAGDLEFDSLAFGRPHTDVLHDEDAGYRIVRLERPLAPGDSLDMHFGLRSEPKGFADGGDVQSLVRRNGTFIDSHVMPAIGYAPHGELSNDRDRRKHGLPPKERMAPPSDPRTRQRNIISRDADWIDFEMTVSTSPDQIAVAPGYLQREWTENGRRYFHYAMDAPILNFYSVLSARYAVEKDTWTSPSGDTVAIEIYHHPGHEYNLDRFIRSTKRSLEYFTENFGPYQHRQVRILEFPRYSTFAQSFANTIPYSESFGFIARVDSVGEDYDYPFYVTAHEVAHQWWGHQVIGADAQGSPVLMESLAEYSALMVMEREYGLHQMRKFFEYLLDDYLVGRASETRRETPLLYAEGQQYLHYKKGGLVFYAVREMIGEERLNAVLRDYVRDVRFQEPPYTTSLELYGRLRAATPDSLHSRLADLFERITLYENRVTAARSNRGADGRYEVEIDVIGKKTYADSVGVHQDAPMDEWVEIGVFAEPAKNKGKTSRPLYLERHRIVSGPQTVRVTVPERPVYAGVDPMLKRLDRDKDDNLHRIDDGS